MGTLFTHIFEYMGDTADVPRVKLGKTLTEENVTKLSSLTGYTPGAVREWHAGFLKDCPTGKLNRKQFIHVYKQFYPNGNAEKFCEHVFRTFDNDSSGDLDFGEYFIAFTVTAQEDPRKKLEWAFSLYDIDRNGFIEKKEMKKIMDAIFDLRSEERKDVNSLDTKVDQIFVKMDTNGDGKLSKDEFIKGCLEDDYLRRLLVPPTS